METYGEFLVPFWRSRKHPRMLTHLHVANFSDEALYFRFQIYRADGSLKEDVSVEKSDGFPVLLAGEEELSCHFLLPANRSSSVWIAGENERGHARVGYCSRDAIDRELVGFAVSAQRTHVVNHPGTAEHREESSSSKAIWFNHRPMVGPPPFSFPEL